MKWVNRLNIPRDCKGNYCKAPTDVYVYIHVSHGRENANMLFRMTNCGQCIGFLRYQISQSYPQKKIFSCKSFVCGIKLKLLVMMCDAGTYLSIRNSLLFLIERQICPNFCLIQTSSLSDFNWLQFLLFVFVLLFLQNTCFDFCAFNWAVSPTLHYERHVTLFFFWQIQHMPYLISRFISLEM